MGVALDVPGPFLWVVFNELSARWDSGRGGAGKRRTPEATRVVIRSAHCGRLFSDYDEDVVMVTTIGIDPYEATHTAVAVNDSETVLGGLAVPADRSQTNTLLDWVRNLDGDGRVWAVEAAGGLGYLLSQQLIARGEHVDNVPPVLASRIRLLGSGRSDKNDPNDARPVAIAVLRQPGLVLVRGDDPHPCAGDVGETPPRLTALRTQAVARFHAVVMLLRPGGMTQRLSADKASVGAVVVAERQQLHPLGPPSLVTKPLARSGFPPTRPWRL